MTESQIPCRDFRIWSDFDQTPMVQVFIQVYIETNQLALCFWSDKYRFKIQNSNNRIFLVKLDYWFLILLFETEVNFKARLLILTLEDNFPIQQPGVFVNGG